MTKRISDTLQLLPDNRTELQQLAEFVTTDGDVSNIPEKWQKLWERILVAERIMRNYVSTNKARKMISSHEVFKDLSRTQVWRYMDAVGEIFGKAEKGNKLFKRLILEQKIAKGLKLAEKWEDGSFFARCLKEYRELWGADGWEDAEKRIEPTANIMVLILGDDGEDVTIDITNPTAIPEQYKPRVLAAIFQSKKLTNPAFSDADDAEIVEDEAE
ncbi:MAG: hypothetical protein ACPG5W_00570 [Flavobacteriales bacterium]